jgi:hypothetical protein
MAAGVFVSLREVAMKAQLLMVLFVMLLAFGLCKADDEPKDKYADIEGKWTIVKLEANGKS